MGESVPGTKQCRAWCFLGLPLLLTVAAGASASDDVEREFSVAVLPLLEQKCLACHGADGYSPSPINPKIGGQHERYIFLALQQYREGSRTHSLMRGSVLGKADQ